MQEFSQSMTVSVGKLGSGIGDSFKAVFDSNASQGTPSVAPFNMTLAAENLFESLGIGVGTDDSMDMVRLSFWLNTAAVLTFIWREWPVYWSPRTPLSNRLAGTRNFFMVRRIHKFVGASAGLVSKAAARVGKALPGDHFKSMISEELRGAQAEFESMVASVQDNFDASASTSSMHSQLGQYNPQLFDSKDDARNVYTPPDTSRLVELVLSKQKLQRRPLQTAYV
uniref:Uncharacterized protein n=1 Tax=Calcidiscus leptoporus TaxID=127549 RepID=A0A7S0IQH5_9EUKA|mmetsp:Transcript_16240/g.37155  ORF Transcript_16240/g.37155 Transcript_16240/m.37155 type:complete len:225 (+) Transcript_16240:1-675(+)